VLLNIARFSYQRRQGLIRLIVTTLECLGAARTAELLRGGKIRVYSFAMSI
jgi:hypothetical protein